MALRQSPDSSTSSGDHDQGLAQGGARWLGIKCHVCSDSFSNEPLFAAHLLKAHNLRLVVTEQPRSGGGSAAVSTGRPSSNEEASGNNNGGPFSKCPVCREAVAEDLLPSHLASKHSLAKGGPGKKVDRIRGNAVVDDASGGNFGVTTTTSAAAAAAAASNNNNGVVRLVKSDEADREVVVPNGAATRIVPIFLPSQPLPKLAKSPFSGNPSGPIVALLSLAGGGVVVNEEVSVKEETALEGEEDAADSGAMNLSIKDNNNQRAHLGQHPQHDVGVDHGVGDPLHLQGQPGAYGNGAAAASFDNGSLSSPSMSGNEESESMANDRKKRRKQTQVPDENKDQRYWARRLKNNEAAKRSRDMRIRREKMIFDQNSRLESINNQLQSDNDSLMMENKELKLKMEFIMEENLRLQEIIRGNGLSLNDDDDDEDHHPSHHRHHPHQGQVFQNGTSRSSCPEAQACQGRLPPNGELAASNGGAPQQPHTSSSSPSSSSSSSLSTSSL